MTDTVYFWEDNGAWQLGRKVNPPWYQFDDDRVAVRLLYDPPTAPCVWVPESKLQPYHGDNQPNKKPAEVS